MGFVSGFTFGLFDAKIQQKALSEAVQIGLAAAGASKHDTPPRRVSSPRPTTSWGKWIGYSCNVAEAVWYGFIWLLIVASIFGIDRAARHSLHAGLSLVEHWAKVYLYAGLSLLVAFPVFYGAFLIGLALRRRAKSADA